MNALIQLEALEDAPIDELRREIRTPTQLLQLLTAGRAVLTIRSKRTQARFTFRFRRPDAEPGRRRPIWVSRLGHPPHLPTTDGPQAEYVKLWSFLGTIWPEEGRVWHFNPSAKSPVPVDDQSMVAAAWIARMLPFAVDHLMEEATWWHEGRCGRCGRRLTVPESIESGFGPECVKHVGGAS